MRIVKTDEPELTDACMETLDRMSSEIPSTPAKLASQRNQRHHMLNHLRLLHRHGFIRRVSGGYLSNQLSLPLNATPKLKIVK